MSLNFCHKREETEDKKFRIFEEDKTVFLPEVKTFPIRNLTVLIPEVTQVHRGHYRTWEKRLFVRNLSVLF